MDDQPGLFEEPERVASPSAPEMTRGERRVALLRTRIANGIHPLGRPVLLHPLSSRDWQDRENGPRCGTCAFRQLVRYHNKTYPKCHYPDVNSYNHPRDTNCESSDIRKYWPACRDYQQAQGE